MKLVCVIAAAMLAGCSGNIPAHVINHAQAECGPHGGISTLNTVLWFCVTCMDGLHIDMRDLSDR